MTNMSRGDLRKLRFREGLDPVVYDSVIIVPSPDIAECGYRRMLIVGVRDGSPVEIADECDDVIWSGYSANGSWVYASAPKITITTDITHAKIGRSMKNRANII